MNDSSENKESEEKNELVYHYIKSPHCVDIPITGAYGGLDNNTGQCFMAVYVERPPIPQEIHLTPSIEDPSKADETRVGKAGTIRSVGAVLHFDINTAVALHHWLGGKIEEFKKAHPEIFVKDEKNIGDDDGS